MLFSVNILQKLPEAIAFGQNPKIVQLPQRQGTGEEFKGSTVEFKGSTAK
ncbi:MAG: hypothetical protein V7L05_24465 [Nostoc sp.]